MDIASYIPNMADYIDWWVTLGKYTTEKLLLEAQLEQLQAELVKEMLQGEGKRPSMAELQKTVLILGKDEQSRQTLNKLVQDIALLEGEIAVLRGKIKAEEMKLSIFQTLSANSRNMLNLEA